MGNSKQQIYIVTSGNDHKEVIKAYTQLHELYESLKNEDCIDKYTDIKDFIIDDEVQRARISKWSQFWEKRADESMSKVIKAGESFGFNETAFDELKKTLSQHYEVCDYNMHDCGKSILDDWIYTSSSSLTLISKISIQQKNKDKVYKEISNIENTTIIDRAYFSSKMIETTSNDFNLYYW